MYYIRQGSTIKVVIGPAVAVGDGFTPVTTLALSSADEAEVILHDNGTVVDISGYTWAAITTADGYYHLTLQSGISNTVGHMTVVVNDDSLILPLRADFTVLEEAVYDAMFAGSALGYVANAPVNVAQVSGDGTAADTLELFAEALDQSTGQLDSGSFAANAITDAAVAADVTIASVTGAVGSVTGAVGSVTGAVGSVTAGVTLANDAITAAKFDESTAFPLASADSGSTQVARTGADADTLETLSDQIDGVSASALVVASGTIGSTGNDTTHLHLDGLTQGDDELNDLLIVVFDNSTSEYHSRWILDWVISTELATVATLPFTPENAVDSYVILAVRQDVTGGSGASAADIADAVWDEVASGHTTNGTYGKAFSGATNVFLASGIAGTINTLDALDTAQDTQHGTTQTAIADVPTVAEFEARTLVAEAYFDPAADTVAHVTLVDTTTTNTDMRGTDSAATAAEMAKVPKSDSNVTWNATALASINTQADLALSDYDPPTKAEMEARTIAAASYATSTAQTTAQNDLDIITGPDGVTLATAQANYAPLKPTTAGRTLDVTAGGNAGIDWANIEAPTTTVGLSGTTVLDVTTKTGYSLASTGLDSISTTAPTGVAANFREMIVQVWRRFFKRAVLDTGDNEIRTYADNGTTILTTQIVSDDGTTQDQGAAT